MTDLTEQTLEEIATRQRKRPSPRALRRQAHWKRFMDNLEAYLRARRGRASALARYLGVNRQNVHRWFKDRHTAIPAWAAVWTNIWFSKQGESICPPGERQTPVNLELPLDSGTGDASKARRE